ncbi:MAG: amidohydrolase family protein [Gemmataceae bacterium]
MDTQTLTARVVCPIDQPALAGGQVTIAGERIVAVEPAGSRRADLDLGNVALLPGFVNAHTHLDLSGLRGRCPPSNDFTTWLKQVIAHRRQQAADEMEADIRTGLRACLAAGTTLVGDISATGASAAILREAPITSVVFHELLGLTPERAASATETARSFLEHFGAAERCRPGLSPHAPYSVHADLFRSAAELARRFAVPLAVHLAESQEELQLLREHAGPFVSFLQKLGVWHPDGLVRSPAEVIARCAAAPQRLFVHGNYLDPANSFEPGSTIVYCPRTHAAFGHDPHPFRELIARNVTVALGTDSLASNPDLDVLAEARFLHARHGDLEGASLLRMLTLNGATALGMESETGSLTPGKYADMVVLPVAEEELPDPYALLLESSQPVARVMWHGAWI